MKKEALTLYPDELAGVFPDTNPMQAEVFFYLTAEEPVADWRQCRPNQGSLFIVGDPKQSIYRFRSVDVTSFLNVRKLFGEGAGDVLKLTRNFRSRSGLLDYFNKTFTTLLPEDTPYQSRFEEITGEKVKDAGIYHIT